MARTADCKLNHKYRSHNHKIFASVILATTYRGRSFSDKIIIWPIRSLELLLTSMAGDEYKKEQLFRAFCQRVCTFSRSHSSRRLLFAFFRDRFFSFFLTGVFDLRVICTKGYPDENSEGNGDE